jgi:hypothetical protein
MQGDLWVNFNGLGDYFLWTVLLITDAVQIFALLSPWKKLCIKFDKNGLGYIMCRFFCRLIRSPWLDGYLEDRPIEGGVDLPVAVAEGRPDEQVDFF